MLIRQGVIIKRDKGSTACMVGVGWALVQRWQAVLQLFFGEKRCVACSSVFLPKGSPKGEEKLCFSCRSKLTPRIQGYCPICAAIFSWHDLPAVLCGQCISHRPPWDKAIFFGLYEGLLRHLLLRLKFHGHLHLAPVLGELLLLYPKIEELEVDVVIPMPLHIQRLRQRGFNQSLELAHPLAAFLKKPLCHESLRRTRRTAPQAGLSHGDRLINMENAFEASKSLRGKKVLLLDDVMTTGMTMRSATFALLEAGALSVTVAAISKTPLQRLAFS